jgi:hypothetical protein
MGDSRQPAVSDQPSAISNEARSCALLSMSNLFVFLFLTPTD